MTFVVALPIALPGIVTGIALRSAISLMDIPFSTFTAGHQKMLPIWILTQFTRPRERPLTNVKRMTKSL